MGRKESNQTNIWNSFVGMNYTEGKKFSNYKYKGFP